MSEKRTRVIIDTIIALLLYAVMEFFDEKLNRLITACVVASIIILTTILWPKKVRKPRRRIYKPDLEEEKRRGEVEKTIAEHQVWWDEMESLFVKAGWKVKTVDEWEYVWFWDRLPNKTKWP